MLKCHLSIFQEATTSSRFATGFVACILVRDTNVASLHYIGRSGYRPKPIECKAKTANSNAHRLSGLVVSPYLVPKAFRADKLLSAKKEWREFEKVMRKRSGWSIIQNGEERGCVQLDGKFLHGDYDLFDVIPVPKSSLGPGNKLKKNLKVGHLAAVEKLGGQDSFRAWGVTPVQDYVNPRLGSPMVQHGGSMQFDDKFEPDIHVFTPDHQYRLYENVKADFYSKYFPTREPLGLKNNSY